MGNNAKENVDGDFYIIEGCCALCGVPQVHSPELVGVTEKDGDCFMKRQPETATETTRMIETLTYSDLACFRYRGTNIKIQEQMVFEFGFQNLSQIDFPVLNLDLKA